jgi:hypothetical protein
MGQHSKRPIGNYAKVFHTLAEQNIAQGAEENHDQEEEKSFEV